MSLTTDIAHLTGQVTDLVDRVDGWIDAADARLVAALRAVPDMYRKYYVHADAGDDENTGALDAPLQTIEEAFRRTPRGGVLTLYLLTDVAPSARIYAPGGAVRIYGYDAAAASVTERSIVWSGQLVDDDGSLYPAGINMRGGDYLYFERIRHVVPQLSGDIVDWHRGIIDSYHSSTVAFEDCVIDAASAADAYLLRAHASSRLTVAFGGTTITAAAQGHVFYGIAADDDPNGWWRYETNLTSA